MTGSKGKMLKEALSNPEPENAVKVMESLGLFMAKEKGPNFEHKEEVKEEEERLEVLNMNNNAMMSKMSDTERGNMEDLIVNAMVKQEGLQQVQMCNANVNDHFLGKILAKLSDHREDHQVKELWMESNPIGDEGMKQLAQFMESDDRIETVKLYNNKKTISTKVLNQLLDALSNNETITKFVFDGFRFQHQRDRKEKYLRRNQEIARRRRVQQRKQRQAMQQ